MNRRTLTTLIRQGVFCFNFLLNLLYSTSTDTPGLSDQSPLSQSVLFCSLATKRNSPDNRRLKTTGEDVKISHLTYINNRCRVSLINRQACVY